MLASFIFLALFNFFNSIYIFLITLIFFFYSFIAINNSFDEFKYVIENNGGFVRCGWDGDVKTELKIKEDTKATIRCILPNGDISGKTCVYSGDPAKYEVIFAKAY